MMTSVATKQMNFTTGEKAVLAIAAAVMIIGMPAFAAIRDAGFFASHQQISTAQICDSSETLEECLGPLPEIG